MSNAKKVNNQTLSPAEMQKPETAIIQNEYFEIDLGHKSVFARKWKAKDRKNFRKALKESEDIDASITNTLVLNCLEDKNVALSLKEIQYILIELRKLSISDSFTFEYTCSECAFKNTQKLKIDDVTKMHFKKWETVDDVELGNISNVKFYNDNKDEEDDAKTLAFHTLSINGDKTKSFVEIVEIFDDMDINEFDAIFEQFTEMIFDIDNELKMVCTECKHEQIYEFDEIPGFFPNTWTK